MGYQQMSHIFIVDSGTISKDWKYEHWSKLVTAFVQLFFYSIVMCIKSNLNIVVQKSSSRIHLNAELFRSQRKGSPGVEVVFEHE